MLHEPVYSIIDWKSKESHIFATVALLATLIHFFCSRIIYEVFKKKRVERSQMVDDFFFSDKPIKIEIFHKLLERKYVWWGLVITLTFITLPTITDLYL
jgi:hypothetical protein